MHTLLTMYLIVKKRVEATNNVTDPISIETDDIEENLQTNTTFTSLDTTKRSLASRLKLDASWDKACWSLRAATFL